MRWTFLLAILQKEFKEALRNRTVLLIVFLPLIASVALGWLQAGETRPLNVGVPSSHYSLFSSHLPPNVVRFHPYDHDAVKPEPPMRPGWDALIVAPDDMVASIAEGRPVHLRVIADAELGPMARAAVAQLPLWLQTMGNPPLVHVTVEGALERQVQTGFITIWITVTAVMIGIMMMSGNLAEERERGTLLALATTPAGWGDIIGAKAIFGALLTIMMGTAMLLVHGVSPGSTLTALTMLVPGSLCFAGLGLVIGLLSPNQATARSYGTLVYLPLLVPVFGYDASPVLARWAVLFPSYHLWAGLEAALRPHGDGGGVDSLLSSPLWSHGGWLLGYALVFFVAMIVTATRRRI